MLNFFLSWNTASSTLFISSLNSSTKLQKHKTQNFYVWPYTVSLEFLLGIKLFLSCSDLPVNANVIRKSRKELKNNNKSIHKILKQHILFQEHIYQYGFEFDEFLTCAFDSFDFNGDRKKDRAILDPLSFCCKYVEGNFYKYIHNKVKMRYVADVCKIRDSGQNVNFKKIQFNSSDFLEGFLTLNAFTIQSYKVKVGQIYENYKLCKFITFEPDLFYSNKTVKGLILESIPAFYKEIIDLILHFFPFCETDKVVPCLECNSCNQLDSMDCENLALEHLRNQCYVCGGRGTREFILKQQQPLFIKVKIQSL